MKLYTEEQITIAINEARSLEDWQDLIFTYNANEIIEKLTPIALPSDEEISEESMDLYGKLSASLNDVLQYKAFKRGAKWMRNKIQGGEQ